MDSELQFKLSRVTCDAISALLYGAWTAAYDTRKRVSEMKNDGSKDWVEFQVERVKSSTAAESAARAALDEFQAQLPRNFLGGF